MPETGELNGQRLWLALLPDHHLVKEPAAASSAAVMTHAHPAHLAQGHGLNEEFIMLREDREKTDQRCLQRHFPNHIHVFSVIIFREYCIYIALFEFVDIVFAHNHEPLPCVAQVTDDVEEDAGVGAAATDIASADGDSILYH